MGHPGLHLGARDDRRGVPDLVSVCLPNEAHFDATMQVIEAGVPLLAEKPLAFDLGEADQMLAAAATGTCSSPSTSTTGTPSRSAGPGPR